MSRHPDGSAGQPQGESNQSPPRIMPPAYLLIAVVVMVALNYLLPGQQIVLGPWRWAGVVGIVAGFAIVFRIWLIFQRRKTTIVPGQQSSELVTSGLFRISRNPIYLAMVILLVGVAVSLGSLTPWLVIPVFIFIITRNIITLEEAMLQEAFGPAYAEYRARVRRWI